MKQSAEKVTEALDVLTSSLKDLQKQEPSIQDIMAALSVKLSEYVTERKNVLGRKASCERRIKNIEKEEADRQKGIVTVSTEYRVGHDKLSDLPLFHHSIGKLIDDFNRYNELIPATATALSAVARIKDE